MSVTVRFGQAGDLETIAGDDEAVSRSVLAWKLQSKHILIAVDNDEPVGYLRLEHFWSKFPYIGLITVKPAYRKRGVGSALLRFLEEHLKGEGAAKLYSSSVVTEPEPQRWHKHMGFKECGFINGINPGEIGEVFFEKSLAD